MDICYKCQSQKSLLTGCLHQFCESCFKAFVFESLLINPYTPISCPECGIIVPKPSLYSLFGGIENYSKIHNGYEKFDCVLCYQEKLIKDSIFIGCEHLYCKECVQMYISEKVRINDFEDGISCPECSQFIEDDVLAQVLSLEEFKMYKKILKAKASLVKNKPQVYRWCMVCDRCVIIKLDSPEFYCRTCQVSFCARCKQAVHTGECDLVDFETDQIKVSELTKSEVPEDIFKCPICLNAVFLDKGCKAIKCPWPACKNTIFCVLCGEILDIKEHFSHYSKEGPFGSTCNTTDKRNTDEKKTPNSPNS